VLDFFGEILGPGTAGDENSGGLGVDFVQDANSICVCVSCIAEIER
jgi:hypothetical protein